MSSEKSIKAQGGRRGVDEGQSGPPLISIITVVYNGVDLLQQCIDSVLGQGFRDFEYLVIDGGSSDGTVDVIRRNEGQIDYWLSEPDSGIYEAMNKGIAAARGEWLYFLGVDDVLAGPGVLASIATYLSADRSLVYGAVRYPDGRMVRSQIGPRTLLHNTVHHQGAFYNTALFKDWRYDTDLRIVADYELNILLYRSGAPCLRLNETVAVCGDRGVSLTSLGAAFRETNIVRRRHVGAVLNALATVAFWMEYSLYRVVLACRGRGEGQNSAGKGGLK